MLCTSKLSIDDISMLIDGLNNGVLAEETRILTDTGYKTYVFVAVDPEIADARYIAGSQRQRALTPFPDSKIERLDVQRTDTLWAAHLEESLMDIHLSLVPRLAEPSIALVDLLKLGVGTVIEIPTFNEIPLYVEGHSVFTGKIGERDGKMAVSIS